MLFKRSSSTMYEFESDGFDDHDAESGDDDRSFSESDASASDDDYDGDENNHPNNAAKKSKGKGSNASAKKKSNAASSKREKAMEVDDYDEDASFNESDASGSDYEEEEEEVVKKSKREGSNAATKKKSNAASSKRKKVVEVDDDDEDDPFSDADASESDYEEDIAQNDRRSNATKKSKGSSNKSAAAKKKSNSASSSNKQEKTIEETYQKKTQLEHILLRPDTYIGSVEPLTQPMFVLDAETERICQREITYTPGFYKIFDEIVVNAADNKQRDPDMDRMDVDVDAERGVISVTNNGKGIPVVKHKEHGCYVATMIFGQLLTGSNFDDNEKKTTGGRNGYGAKLANIFSKKFVVECLDTKQGLKFTQVWRNNMHKTEEPIIEKCSSSEKKKGDYVKITFRPDLERFNMTELDSDAVGLISKRAYDIAGSMANQEGKKLKVYLNGERLKVKDFTSYIDLFDGISTPEVYEKIGDDWEVGIGSVLDGGGFQQISFVNAIATTKGGGHVDYITNLLVKRLQAAVKKKNKGGKDVKPAQVKNHLSVFINCLVENPTFDSQTKENLTTKPSTFKKDVQLSEQFLKKVEKCGVVESIMQFAKFQEGRALQRKGGTKKNKLKGISKLDDANFAGTQKSKDCTLIITEGDSAKSLAVSGLSVVGRDYYGVFPLKGKPLNVRDATHAQIMKNEEIMNLVEIMGLKFKQTYTKENIKTLRYGSLMIMADQDHDGSHIKGLIINFIHHFWPSLLDVPGFLQQFITPIVKCTKGNKKTKTFYTLPQFEEWKNATGNEAKGWKIKYYKGLGTSTSSEAKEYFSNLDVHEIHFNDLSSDIISHSDSDDEMETEEDVDVAISSGADLIDMAFNKKKADERKKWLSNIAKDTFLNYSDAQRNGVNYSEFINRELALFSQYDVQRSLPNVLDGLKISQRKVLYACIKKKLKNEIKVAQLAGYVGEHSAYHHGEASLHGAIVNMAQNYCGSNNVNLLTPSGQFGTRRMGGKDHASARYIFTRLEKITRAIFHPDDDDLLDYLNDDGLSIEPEFYMPVIPMVLVNGSEGIGTGWSSNIKSHDPRVIISNLRKMIQHEEPEEMHPYFSGWSGEIMAETGRREGSYILKGKIKRTSNTTLLISELPVGRWTQDYKEKILEKMMAGADKADDKKKKKKGEEKESAEKTDIDEITDFKENHTDTTVSFTVIASKESIDNMEKEKDGLYGKFKLLATISTNNMTAFDKDGKIRQYKTALDILKDFFPQRMVYYIARKELLLQKMKKELSMLENKARFVEEVCKGELIVSDRKRSELLAELKDRGYDLFPKDPKDEEETDTEGENSEGDHPESSSDAELAKGYEYLLGMKIWTLTFERAEELRRQRTEKAEEVETLEGTSPESIYLADLDAIEELLDERDRDLGIETKLQKQVQSKSKSSVAKKIAKKSTKTKNEDEWNSEEEDFVSEKPAAVKKKKANSAAEDDEPLSEFKTDLCDIMSDDDSECSMPAKISKSGSMKVFRKGKKPKTSLKTKPASKSSSAKSDRPAPKRKGSLQDTSDDDSTSSIPTKKPRAVSKSKSAPNKGSTKAEKPVARRSGGSGGSRKAKKEKATPRLSSKGKAAVSLGIPSYFSSKKKSSGSSALRNLEDSSPESHGNAACIQDMDDFLVDSDENNTKQATEAFDEARVRMKKKGYGGLLKKSKAARARKRELDDSSSPQTDDSPAKRKKTTTKPSYQEDSSSGEESSDFGY